MRDYLSDQRLITTVAQQYRAQQPNAPTAGRAAIITAGVPGAGKTSALGTIATGYRRIDPDEIKDILLARLAAAGLLDVRLAHALSDGNPVSPGELAGWVHRASTDAADQVRSASLQLGENFVMEGTLSWHALPASHVNELALGGYEKLTVLDIEVPLTVAVEQSKRRWWEARHSGLLTHGVHIGGRFIAESLLAQLYSGPRTASVCASNVRDLYNDANAAGIETEVLIVSRTATGSEYKARLTPGGDVEPWQNAPLGAVCINCGAVLKGAAAILKGSGAAR
ncbi:MAG: hypothetical protein U5N53_12555 [Mycobacterium sp.]|nr:hypothetical protein [Mycobacterium sp.]